MTCIIAVKTRYGIVMGGDSMSSDGYSNQRVISFKKVFRKGDMLIGYTTSFRMGQLLEHDLIIPKHPKDKSDIAYLVSDFIPAVRECLRDGGFAKVENNQEEGGQFLIVYHGEIYEVNSDFQVNCFANDFDVIGCGYQYALGALEIIWHLGYPIARDKTEEWLHRIFRVCEHFSDGVIGPYYFIWDTEQGHE